MSPLAIFLPVGTSVDLAECQHYRNMVGREVLDIKSTGISLGWGPVDFAKIQQNTVGREVLNECH